jgi:uncharacterized protein YndB with AHSA1/START domain
MTERSAVHATFTLERSYPVAVEHVFAAWSEPAAKARWFAGPTSEHALDFRIGGVETASGEHDGNTLRFTTTYADIVAGERIVYTSTLHAGDVLATVSMTTVEFVPMADSTRLILTEQGTYLDGHELPQWREKGTGDQLDALGAQLTNGAA